MRVLITGATGKLGCLATGGLMRAFREVELPSVLGAEVGEGVEDFSVGDEVLGQLAAGDGAYAEYTVLAEPLAKKPAGMSFVTAATLPAAATAYDGVHQLALAPGSTLLVNGVGGGVGVAAAQIAKGLGLVVTGTAGAAKRDFIESLGVTRVTHGEGVADRIRAAAPGGVDAIFDLVGGEALEAVAPVASDPSKVISAADAATAVRGSFIQRARTRDVLVEVATSPRRASSIRMSPTSCPSTVRTEALSKVESGHSQGKVVLEVS